MMTVEAMYKEMVEENSAGGWVNPRLESIENPEFPDHFMIKLDDFERIYESYNVDIYSVSKWSNHVTIHCKQDKW